MVGLRNSIMRVFSEWSQSTYRVKNFVTGWKPVHLVVCGPDDEGAKALVETIPRWYSPQHSISLYGPALWAKKLRSRVIVSWDSDDAAAASATRHALNPTRRVIFVVAVADPHDLISEPSRVLPHHFSQGADYRLFVDGKTRSFTKPGVVSRSADAISLRELDADSTVFVRREDIVASPDEVRKTLTGVVARAGGPASVPEGDPDRLSTTMTIANWAGSPNRVARVSQQRHRFPELAKIAEGLGYPPTQLPHPPGTVAGRGMIIGFHTPDEIYRMEAERLKRSLDALGLEYRVTVVEPESNWVRTTLLKPTWIAPVRDELRGPLLYVDVDAFVHEDPWPHVSELEGDVAAVVYPTGELNSATLWINDTVGAKTLLEKWASGSGSRRLTDNGTLRQVGDDSDQGVLRLVVEAEEASEEPVFRFSRLSPNLATIFDRTDEYRFGSIAIEQLQVSREVTQRAKRLARRRDRLAQLGG